MQNLNRSNTQVKEYFFVTMQREKERLKQQGQSIADLSIGNPDMPAPGKVLDTLHQSSSQPGVHGYQPNAGSLIIRESVVSWYKRFFNVDIDVSKEIVPLQGSRQGILQLSQSILQQGDKVLVPNPGYPSYTFAAKMMGATAVPYDLKPTNNYLPDFKELEKTGMDGVKIMWVNYPHMPTGATAGKKIFEQLIEFARNNNIIIVNDHAYSFIMNDLPVSILNVDGAKDVALELNSLSKNYNLAGWRLGFLAGNPNVLHDLLQLKSHLDSGIALPLQHMAVSALDMEQDWFDSINETYSERRQYAVELAKSLNCEPAGGPAGMFLWVKMPEMDLASRKFVEKIFYDIGVLVAPGSLFGSNGEGHLRISLCAPAEVIKEGIEKVYNSGIINHKLT